jgi:DNA-binding transcriptional LysR family regulator
MHLVQTVGGHMDLRQIENIITIEQEQSISRAAEKLFLTQSALNQQLLKLERELGTPLFERRKQHDPNSGRAYLSEYSQTDDKHEAGYLPDHS